MKRKIDETMQSDSEIEDVDDKEPREVASKRTRNQNDSNDVNIRLIKHSSNRIFDYSNIRVFE